MFLIPHQIVITFRSFIDPQASFVLSDKLSTGETSFIARVIIQVFSYLGVYLLVLVVLGNAPETATLETHDLLNRFVGQSSIFFSTLRWMWHCITTRRKEPVSSFNLGASLALTLLFGVTVSLSDIGLIGIHSCTTAGRSVHDFPASITSDSEALALVKANLLNGTDPITVNAYRCDSANTISNLTLASPIVSNSSTLPKARICTDLHNLTYADGSAFRKLNSTDSDALMPKYLFFDSVFGGNMYLAAPTRQMVTGPTVRDGLAVIPHDTGVTMIAGVPDLSAQKRVSIDQTLALEIEVGCLSLGIVESISVLGRVVDPNEIIPDAVYLPTRLDAAYYSGPDNLRTPLAKAADQIRANLSAGLVLPEVNDAAMWQSQVEVIDFFETSNGTSTDTTPLDDCSSDILSALNVFGGPETGLQFQDGPRQPICQFVVLGGAQMTPPDYAVTSEYMVCATTTQVNMVSAALSVDQNDFVTSNITRLPSDINVIQALLYNPSNPSAIDDPTASAPIIRFTLSPNPAGESQHYIHQASRIGMFDNPGTFSRGSGNAGTVFMQTALNIWAKDTWPGIGLIDSNFLEANFSAGQVTKWAGQVGASFILGSVGYNGWVARGAQPLTVVSTGGYPATCYGALYVFGFLPFVLALLSVFCCIVVMGVLARLKEARKMQEKYGGLKPHIDISSQDDLRRTTLLRRVDGPTARFEPVDSNGNDSGVTVHVDDDMESWIIVHHSRNSSAEKVLVLRAHEATVVTTL